MHPHRLFRLDVVQFLESRVQILLRFVSFGDKSPINAAEEDQGRDEGQRQQQDWLLGMEVEEEDPAEGHERGGRGGGDEEPMHRRQQDRADRLANYNSWWETIKCLIPQNLDPVISVLLGVAGNTRSPRNAQAGWNCPFASSFLIAVAL